MRQLIRNLKIALLVFLALSVALLAALAIQQNRSQNELFVAAGENKAALKTRYAAAGAIYDRNGAVLAESVSGERTYSSDAATAAAMLHIVGDYTHNIDNTIEARCQGSLLGTGRNLLRQVILDFNGCGLQGDAVTLTADSRLSTTAYQLLDGRRGAVVLLNYQTGAILAAVSSPSTSPASVIAYKDIPDTALFNRALLGRYAPGSTFKVITTAAWLQSPDYDPDLIISCQGESTVSPTGADETGDGHGDIALDQAFADSCNVFFGQAGAGLGRTAILNEARDFGIGQTFRIDELNSGDSRIEAIDDPTALSWLAIGQPTGDSVLIMTPVQMAMIAGAIGNGGVMMQPHIIDHLTDPMGDDYRQLQLSALRTVADAAAIERLEELMIETTTSGTGQAAAVSGCTVAGKTGTLQVEGQKNTALYIGYITDDQYPYAIAVVIEEGGAGSKTAAPIAGKLFKALLKSLDAG